MRQSVEILARVTFDAPAGLNRTELQDHAQWALANAKAIPAVAVSADVLAIREEAAMFNSNGDQWEADPDKPWDLRKGGEHILSVSVPFDHIARTSPMKPAVAAGMVAEALNFMAGRVPPPDAAASETLAKRVEELEAALRRINDYPASENSEPDDMGDALVAIYAIAEQALGEKAEASAPTPKMVCGECGNDGDDTLTIGIDGVWDADTGRWTLHYNGEGLDCSACDYRTRLGVDAFPDGLQVSPDGREVLL